MEISVRRIYSFLNGFISCMKSTKKIGKLMLPTASIITENGAKTCSIVDININKIIELTEKQFNVNEIYHISYKNKEQFYMMSKLILDKYKAPLLYVKKTNETVKINGRNTIQTYDNFYVSSEVMFDTKSWICFVIRKYIIYYILNGCYSSCKRVHIINGKDMSALVVKCEITKFTFKNIEKLKILNGDK